MSQKNSVQRLYYLLNENKKLSGNNSSLSLAQLQNAITFFEKEITAIKSEELELRNSIDEQKAVISRLEKEKSLNLADQVKSTSEITIRVESNSFTEAEMEVTYLQNNFDSPSADIRNTLSPPLPRPSSRQPKSAE